MDFYSPINQASTTHVTNNNNNDSNSSSGGSSNNSSTRGGSHGGGGVAGRGGGTGGESDHFPAHNVHQGQPPSAGTSLEESFMQMRVQPPLGKDGIQGPYPLRPGQPDCVFYLRNGTCGFGTNCRFNHPPLQKMEATAAAPLKDDAHEGFLQSECPYYAKMGICKLGASCKYRHSQHNDGLAASEQPQLNFLGLPLRPGNRDCIYYIRNGSCKFGVTCKFHHPQPAADGSLQSPASSLNSASTPLSPVRVPYPPTQPLWPTPRQHHAPAGSGMPGPHVPLMPVIVPSPAWNMLQQGPLNPMPLPGVWPPGAVPKGFTQGAMQQPFHPSGGFPGYGAPSANIAPQAIWMSQRTADFPERHGQPDCHQFVKTGDCKFGANCKYNHPKITAFVSHPPALNPMGLPLRPGQPSCTYYVKHGVCKYGSVCKFDHPVAGLRHNPSASSLHEAPIFPYSTGSSPTSMAALSSEKFGEATKAHESTQPSSGKLNSESVEDI